MLKLSRWRELYHTITNKIKKLFNLKELFNLRQKELHCKKSYEELKNGIT